MAGRLVRLLVAAALVLGGVAIAAPSAQAAATELRYACASNSNGLLRAASGPTSCNTKKEALVTFSVAAPVSVCVQPDGSVRLIPLRDCTKASGRQILVPSSTPTRFCASATGVLRYTTGSCLSTETEYVVQNHPPTNITLSNAAVPENEPVGTVVGTLSATDSDPGDVITFSLVSGTGSADNASFAISAGKLTTNAVFDYETRASYSVRVRATDLLGGTFEKAFTISILDVVENHPPTDISLSNTNVAENQPAGTTVGALSGTDPDGDALTFSVVTTGVPFQVTGTNLVTTQVLDFETVPSYPLTLRATDPSGASYDEAFTITVTNANDAPTGLALSNSTIAENQPSGSAVGQLSATDQDGDSLVFALVPGAGDTDNASFTIAGTTLKTAAAFDYETRSSYSVRVAASDGHGGTTEQTFTITVTDAPDAPTDLSLSPSTVAENQPSGTTVGTLSATDQDAGDTFTYALVAGTGDTGNASFTIDGATLKTAAVFDYETASTYSVRVRVTDGYGLSFEKALTVSVTNVSEAPTDLALTTSSVAENQPTGTSVGTFTTTDPDAGDTFTYALVAGTGDADNASFTIDGSTLKTAAVFDFEAQNTYSIRVQVTDSGNHTFEKALTVGITNVDEAPTDLALSNSSIAENSPTLSSIGTLSSTDPDAGDTFTYSLVSGTGSTDNAKFAISGNTLKAAVSLNYEQTPTLSVRIRTTDSGGLAYERAFTVTVTDVNDLPVAADLTLTAGNSAIGNTVLVVNDPTDPAPAVSGVHKTVATDLLAGATDEDGTGTLAIVPATLTTANGGSVTIEADGDFVYAPPAGCSHIPDSFTYTVTDQNTTKPPGTAGTDTGQVTIAVTSCVWYVDAGAPAGGDGTSLAPFDTLASLNGAGGVGDADTSGDILYVAAGTYTGGLSLEANQQLAGRKHGLTVGSDVLEAGDPTASTTIAGGLVLGANTGVQGINLGASAGPALSGTSIGTSAVDTVTSGAITNPTGGAINVNGGTLNAHFSSTSATGGTNGIALTGLAGGSVTSDGGTLADATGADVLVSGGTATISIAAAVSDDVGLLVSVFGATGGSVSLTGNISDGNDGDGSGIALTGNTGAVVSFAGTLTLSTGANPAFTATGGGTVTATGTGSTIATTTGTALFVSNTAIGASGLAFRSVSANGAPNGIVLNNTGNGGLTVTGNGGACAAPTDACTGGTIQATTADAVSLTGASAVSLTRLRLINNLGNGIRGNGVNGFALVDSVVNGNGDNGDTDEAGLNFTNLAGTASITRTLVAHSIEDNARVANTTGTLTLTVTDSTFADTATVSPGNNGLTLVAGLNPGDTASITANVLGSTFLRNRADGLQAATNQGGSLALTVADSASVQSQFDANNIGLDLGDNSTGIFKYSLTGLTVTGVAASPINVNLASLGSAMSGTIADNTITNGNSLSGPGIRVVGNGTGTLTTAITGNTVSQVQNFGIQVQARDGSNHVNATVTGNNVTTGGGGGLEPIRIDAGATSTDTVAVCADVASNTASTTAVGISAVRIRQRFTGTTFQFKGYSGAATDDTAVVNRLLATNTIATATADHGGAGFVGVTSCPTPN